ncbi:protein of unknown function [Burkholderia multivorans]
MARGLACSCCLRHCRLVAPAGGAAVSGCRVSADARPLPQACHPQRKGGCADFNGAAPGLVADACDAVSATCAAGALAPSKCRPR